MAARQPWAPKIWLYDFCGIQLPYFIDMAVRLFGYDCSVLGYACRLLETWLR